MTIHEYKADFIKKHGRDGWHVETGSMRPDGTYSKLYLFADGAQLTEVNRPVFETATAEVTIKGVKATLTGDLKLFETECWNTDDPVSVKWYEKW